MLRTKVKIQVAAFLAIALLGISYVSFEYVGLGQYFGKGGYTVQLRLAEAGGIFPNAEVTYRGVAVGRMGAVGLDEDGVVAEVAIDADAPPIADDLTAVVANRSAIGEQYLDLRPKRDSGPYLTQGSVIHEADTKLPPSVDTVLANANSFVASVPKESLTTVVDELYDATQGTGQNLQVLLDTGGSFVREASANLPQTTALLRDSATVLRTQKEDGQLLRSFSGNLRALAARVRQSDGDLRTVLATGPATAQQITGLLNETGPNLGVLLSNLLSTSQVFLTEQDGFRGLLVGLPKALEVGDKVIDDQGLRLGLTLSFFQPLPCVAGYGGTEKRAGSDTAGRPLNTGARCTASAASGVNVRGAQNAPGREVQSEEFRPTVLSSQDPLVDGLDELMGVTK